MKTTLLFLSVLLSANIFGQNVYIPDANFKAYLVGNFGINSNGDTEIQVSEASTFDGGISVLNQNISDLTGIEAFTTLTNLECGYNQLTSLDVSQNIALTNLECGYNQLTSLDVSQNIALTYLSCRSNQLTSLDVSQNIALTYLGCNSNQITSLDVSQNTALDELRCWFNLLTSLNTNGPYALTYIDCRGNELTSLDVSQNTALEYLFCGGSQLTSLDVSQNTALILLDCNTNQLTSLDVSQNNALVNLDCSWNQLTSLDVSQNTALWSLACSNNQLTCLNVANGNNDNVDNVFDLNLTAMSNWNLNCIEVDNAAWSAENWSSYVDQQVSFSENCNNDCSSSTVEINELPTSKNPIQILDMIGRETSFKPNTPLIYVYDDGSIEKVFSVEY